LDNEANLTVTQREKLTWLTRRSMRLRLKTARAARWRNDFNEFYNKTDPQEAEAYLTRWCYPAIRSRLEPIKEFVATVEPYRYGIIAWQQSQLPNGISRSNDAAIGRIRSAARGLQEPETFITMIMLDRAGIAPQLR